MEQLTQACEPAPFGVKQENVLDETYRKAGKMDSECFSSALDPFNTDLIKIIRGYLLEGRRSNKGIKAELYKLNIYGKFLIFVHPYYPVLCFCLGSGSFFKPHVDTPRSENMFGSLVVVFPTPHEGGALLLRHHGQEWIFDSAKALAAVDKPTIGYVAFFSDIEHEVAPVISGHRITLTYNLYFDDDGGPVSENNAASNHLIPPELQLPNQEGFREAFKALLGNPEFMADGGTLAFGLRHVYPIKESLKHVYNILKGSDAVVFQCMRALGFDPVLYVYYNKVEVNDKDEEQEEWEEQKEREEEDEDKDEDKDKDDSNPPQGAIIDRLIIFGDSYYEKSVLDVVQEKGGIPVRQDGGKAPSYRDPDFENPEPVEWVTRLTTYNRQRDAFAAYGNEATLSWAYGDVCMIVRIGKAGDRLAFPTVDLVKREHQKSWDQRHYY